MARIQGEPNTGSADGLPSCQVKRDVGPWLWLLTLGAVVNIYYLFEAIRLPGPLDAHVVVPAVIQFSVSAFRCLFPNRYKDNVAFHDTPLPSILLTRVLATAVEVAWIYQFSRILRIVNVDGIAWIDVLSWLMVLQVVLSQVCVWAAIATRRVALNFYEELGWALIFVANTIASAALYVTLDSRGTIGSILVLNMMFGLAYLPWQCFHLRSLRADARATETQAPITLRLPPKDSPRPSRSVDDAPTRRRGAASSA